MQTYNSNKFLFKRDGMQFTTEASMLPGFNGGSFYIKSARTGVTQLFLLTNSEEVNGDLVAWHGFSPGGLYNVTVFND